MKAHLSGDAAAVLPHIPQNAQRLLLLGEHCEGLAAAFKNLNPSAFCLALRPLNAGKQMPDAAIDQWVHLDLDAGLSKLAVIKSPMDMVVVLPDTWALVKDAKRLLKELRRFMTKGAVCLVWAPNVSHWQRMENLLSGHDEKSLVFDSTHILHLLREAGWTVQTLGARQSAAQQNEQVLQRWAAVATGLNMASAQVQRTLLTKQWVVTAINGPANPDLHVAAMSLVKRVAGTNEARMQYPLNALKSLPGVRCVYGEGGLSIPPDYKPGILMLNRQFMTDPGFLAHLEKKVQGGWLLVADMDDDPLHWPEYQASDFMAFKGVHAVTVSTPELARRISVWNPHVHLLPNAVSWIDSKLQTIPKNKERVRIFFGAINRQKDWQPIMQGVTAAAINLGDSVEFVVVHDKEFHDALPKTSIKTFHPTLSHMAYSKVLASCDMALLPLADTSFNRCKSDLKLIECAAAGVVPVCSRVVYAENPAHDSFVKFADTPADWMVTLIKLSKQIGELNRRAKLGYAYVSTTRMHSQQAAIRRDLYLSLLVDRDLLEAQRQQRLKAMQTSPLALAQVG